MAQQPGRNDAGIIQHQAVAGFQELGQFIKMMVACLSRFSV